MLNVSTETGTVNLGLGDNYDFTWGKDSLDIIFQNKYLFRNFILHLHGLSLTNVKISFI